MTSDAQAEICLAFNWVHLFPTWSTAGSMLIVVSPWQLPEGRTGRQLPGRLLRGDDM